MSRTGAPGSGCHHFDVSAMKLTTVLLGIAISTLPTFGQESKLPDQAKQLADKLTEWEADAQANLQKQIAEKRQQVISALQNHLASATKRRDLDGALAIRNYIASISPNDAGNRSDGDGKRQATTDNKNSLVGTFWKMTSDKGNMTLKFTSESEAIWTHGNYTGERVWKLVKEGEIELAGTPDKVGNDVRFTFDLQKGIGKALLRRGGFEVDAKLETKR